MKWFLTSLLFLPALCMAQLRLANIFSDNMIIQRGQPIHIWGKAVPGKTIVISLSKEHKSAKIKEDSTWSVFLNAQGARSSAQTLKVASGSESISLKNILIGDVWICIGQSNMEWPMIKEMHWNHEKQNAAQPLIRFTNPTPAGRYIYGVAYTDSLNRRLNRDSFYLWNGWQACDSNTIKPMSAVGYYFAKSIVAKENIPIGLINLSIGGAPLETFVSREAMQNNKQFAAKVEGDWLTNDALPEWTRERGSHNVGGNKNGYGDDLGLNHAYKPGFAYAAGIEPLQPMPVKGILIYQGESNAQEIERVSEYAALSKLMIDDYRMKWKQPQLPFYFVQLSSIDSVEYKGQLWPELRNEQRKMLHLIPNSGMAVCSDIGARNDVHPTNKKDVGERLARWALKNDYAENIVPSGPLPLRAKFEKDKVVVSFQYAKGLKTSDSKIPSGFSIDGSTDADASIKNDAIIISTNEKPAFIYYGWKPFSDGNLVNSENLPASTFKIRVE